MDVDTPPGPVAWPGLALVEEEETPVDEGLVIPPVGSLLSDPAGALLLVDGGGTGGPVVPLPPIPSSSVGEVSSCSNFLCPLLSGTLRGGSALAAPASLLPSADSLVAVAAWLSGRSPELSACGC